jgi:hypothetical protein
MQNDQNVGGGSSGNVNTGGNINNIGNNTPVGELFQLTANNNPNNTDLQSKIHIVYTDGQTKSSNKDLKSRYQVVINKLSTILLISHMVIASDLTTSQLQQLETVIRTVRRSNSSGGSSSSSSSSGGSGGGIGGVSGGIGVGGTTGGGGKDLGQLGMDGNVVPTQAQLKNGLDIELKLHKNQKDFKKTTTMDLMQDVLMFYQQYAKSCKFGSFIILYSFSDSYFIIIQ